MASDPFFSALAARRTIYDISDSSPISDTRINDIVTKAITHNPSAFNVQSARVVTLLKDEHKKLWDSADLLVKAALPEAVYQSLAPRIARFRAGYGSILFFESDADLTALATQHAAVAPLITECHLNNLYRTVWTAVTAEGFGASLQHYNFLPSFTTKIQEAYDLPKDWKLKAQLVFGTPVGGPMEKAIKAVEGRVKMFGQ